MSNPDADHIGGFLDVFDAFPVETVFVSGDPNNTLTYSTFLRGVRDEGAKTEILRAGALMDWGGVRGDITPEQFRARSADLKDARVAAQDQLEASRSRLSRLKDLERGKDALISHYASLVPVGLDELPPADKNKVYEMMHLRVFAHPDDTLIAEWGCNISPLPRRTSYTRTS